MECVLFHAGFCCVAEAVVLCSCFFDCGCVEVCEFVLFE